MRCPNAEHWMTTIEASRELGDLPTAAMAELVRMKHLETIEAGMWGTWVSRRDVEKLAAKIVVERDRMRQVRTLALSQFGGGNQPYSAPLDGMAAAKALNDVYARSGIGQADPLGRWLFEQAGYPGL